MHHRHYAYTGSQPISPKLSAGLKGECDGSKEITQAKKDAKRNSQHSEGSYLICNWQSEGAVRKGWAALGGGSGKKRVLDQKR